MQPYRTHQAQRRSARGRSSVRAAEPGDASKAGYILRAVQRTELWGFSYVAAGRPFQPVRVGDLRTMERFLADCGRRS